MVGVFLSRHWHDSPSKFGCFFFVSQEEHLNTLVYQLPMTELRLHKVFETMEQGRQSLDIQV